jgi:hypothetical protein
MWILEGLLESALLSVLCLRFLEYDDFGSATSHWEAGALCYTAVIFIVNMKVGEYCMLHVCQSVWELDVVMDVGCVGVFLPVSRQHGAFLGGRVIHFVVVPDCIRY